MSQQAPQQQLSPEQLASRTVATARQALDDLETLLGQLEHDVINLTSDDVMAGEGNLGWYRHEAQAHTIALRQALQALDEQHGQLRGFLQGRGVAVGAR
jgi:hypothetical protein